ALQARRPIVAATTNGDEDSVPDRMACYRKGLPRNQFGGVDGPVYDALRLALKSQKHTDFERIPRGGGRKLSNPQAAFTFHPEGGDPHTFDLPAPPSVRSEAAAWEASELYWQAVCRDVPFAAYDSTAIVKEAASHLATNSSKAFRGTSDAHF